MVAPIPPDISYCLLGALESFHITNDVSTFFYYFNETPLAPLVDAYRYEPGKLHSEYLHGLAGMYLNIYDTWFWNDASREQRVWCVVTAAEQFTNTLIDLQEHLFREYVNERLDANTSPDDDAAQNMWLDQSSIMRHTQFIISALVAKIQAVDVGEFAVALQNPFEYETRLGIRGLRRNYESPDRLTEAELVAKRKEQTNVLKKSSLFLSKLIGKNDVSMFVSGKEIRVEGNRFTFVVKRSNIHSMDHGALNISVHDKTSDERMFDLCWYVTETPALDQVSALVLAVKTGDEDEIIRIGNLFKIEYDIVAKHDYVQPFLPKKPVAAPWDPTAVSRLPDSMFDPLQEHRRAVEYTDNNKGVYLRFIEKFNQRLSLDQIDKSLASYFAPALPQTLVSITQPLTHLCVPQC